jgi:hypothetical protein
MKVRYLKIVAPLVLVATLGAACGKDDPKAASSGDATTSSTESSDTTDDMSMSGDAASFVTTPGAELRAGLTALLQEHVYLAGAAIATAVGAGGDMENAAVKSAVETLDANSVALSDAVASVYGDDAGAQFLELWRKHIGFFVDYTLGGATGDKAKQDTAKAALDKYRQDFGAFVESATKGNLTVDAVAKELQTHVNTLITAIDAVLAKDPSVFPKLREAAGHMPMTAKALAGAIVAANADKFSS